jgi:hypothetical protein
MGVSNPADGGDERNAIGWCTVKGSADTIVIVELAEDGPAHIRNL